jgi:Ca2+-transporting ATPase
MAFYTLVPSQLHNIFNVPQVGVSPIVNEITKNSWIWLSLALSILTIVAVKFSPLISEILPLVFLSADQYLLVALFSFGSLFFFTAVKKHLLMLTWTSHNYL